MSDISYNTHTILFVDDEAKTRKYFARLFGDKFKVIIAEDGVEALEIFKANIDDIAIVVTDQRMPNMTGSQLLEKVAVLKPSCIRILSTAYADIDSAIESVNKGGLYQYITKPWEVNDLEVAMMRAMELYLIEKDRASLLKQKISSVEMMASSDRILTIATQAVCEHEGLRHVSEALKILVELAQAGEDDDDYSDGMDATLNWRDLYLRHLSFVRSVRMGLTQEKLSGLELDYANSVPVTDVVMPVSEAIGCYQWLGGEASLTGWPGPLSAMQEEVKPFFESLAEVMRDAGIILVSEVQGGVEFKLSSRLLAKSLEPFRKVTEEVPSNASINLACAFFRLAHGGAQFEVHPDSRTNMLNLRVLFDLKKRVDVGARGWDSLVAALSENDVFWARYGG